MRRISLLILSSLIFFSSCFRTDYQIILLESHKNQCTGVPFQETKRTKFGEYYPIYFGALTSATFLTYFLSKSASRELLISGTILSFLGSAALLGKTKVSDGSSKYPVTEKEIENFVAKYNSCNSIKIVSYEPISYQKNIFHSSNAETLDQMYKFTFASAYELPTKRKRDNPYLESRYVDAMYLNSTPRLIYTEVKQNIIVPYFGVISELRYRTDDYGICEGQMYRSAESGPYGSFTGKIENNEVVGWSTVSSWDYRTYTNFSTLSKNMISIQNEIIESANYNTSAAKILEKEGFKAESVKLGTLVNEPDPIDSSLTSSFYARGKLVFKNANDRSQDVFFELESNDFLLADGKFTIRNEVSSESTKELEKLMANYKNQKIEKVVTPFFIPFVSNSLYHPHLFRRMREYSSDKYCGTDYEYEYDGFGNKTTYATNKYFSYRVLYFDFYTRKSITSEWLMSETVGLIYDNDCDGSLNFVKVSLESGVKKKFYSEKEAWDYMSDYINEKYPLIQDEAIQKMDSLKAVVAAEAEALKAFDKDKFRINVEFPKREGYMKRYVNSSYFIPNAQNPFAGVWYEEKGQQLILISNSANKMSYWLNLDSYSMSVDKFPTYTEGVVSISETSFSFNGNNNNFIKNSNYSATIKSISDSEIHFSDGTKWIRQGR